MLRTKEQDMLLSEDLLYRIEKDTEVFNIAIKHLVKPGKILELGCGNGIVLNLLSQNFMESIIVGVDLSELLLAEVKEKALKNVVTVKSNIVSDIFIDELFDTIIFHKALHEVESIEGRNGTRQALRNANKYLKENGVLIIRENQKPSNKKVRIKLKSAFAKERFNKFIEDFTPTKAEVFSYENDIAEVSEHIALEYITKYDERDWETEMKEPHFFFNRSEWIKELNDAGFSKVVINEDTINKIDLDKRSMDFELLFDLPIYRSTIVAHK